MSPSPAPAAAVITVTATRKFVTVPPPSPVTVAVTTGATAETISGDQPPRKDAIRTNASVNRNAANAPTKFLNATKSRGVCACAN